MFSWQINGWILNQCLAESQAEGMEAVDDVDAAARYVGKYLHMQSYHVRKYIMSAGWVFPGWISWSRWFNRNYGVYPDQMYPGTLAKLARMSKSERDEIIMPELMNQYD